VNPSDRKALCMSGYTLAGSPMSVSLGVSHTATNPRQSVHSLVTSLPTQSENIPENVTRQKDTRRNLYVLGLPFDFTK
jgi:hypothetical protein